MANGVIVSLCDLSGIIADPWLEAGYDALLIDPQHSSYTVQHQAAGVVEKIPATILGAGARIGEVLRGRKIVFVAGFPPCTDVAVSGARWFEEKRAKDKNFQAKAAIVAEQCRMIGILSGAPWFFENPVSVFSSIFGDPCHTFHPHQFTAHEPDDNYSKLTCLWTGGGFVMPERAQCKDLPEPDDRIHKAPPGEDRANFRSKTPKGFAKAVFMANAPHLRRQFELWQAA
jgi:hypothetical protein